jgi:hypothetical protein
MAIAIGADVYAMHWSVQHLADEAIKVEGVDAVTGSPASSTRLDVRRTLGTYL